MTEPNPDTSTTDVDDQRPAAPQPDRVAHAMEIGDLCARLCQAFGVDDDTHTGFQLTVRGGHIPELTTFPIPPNDGTDFTDEWVTATTKVAERGLTFAVLPGQTIDAPPARDPGPMDVSALPEDIRMEVLLCRILPMLGEVINGAYVDSRTRDWLTSMASLCTTEAAARVNRTIFAMVAPATYGGPETSGITTVPMPEPTTTVDGDYHVFRHPDENATDPNGCAGCGWPENHPFHEMPAES